MLNKIHKYFLFCQLDIFYIKALDFQGQLLVQSLLLELLMLTYSFKSILQVQESVSTLPEIHLISCNNKVRQHPTTSQIPTVLVPLPFHPLPSSGFIDVFNLLNCFISMHCYVLVITLIASGCIYVL